MLYKLEREGGREKSFKEILEKLKFSCDENESRDVVGAYFQLMSSYGEQSNMGKVV